MEDLITLVVLPESESTTPLQDAALPKECQAVKFSFEKRSITVSYEIGSGSMQTKLPKVTQTPPDCTDRFEPVIKTIDS